jgi:phospholipid N-methyltransferase
VPWPPHEYELGGRPDARQRRDWNFEGQGEQCIATTDAMMFVRVFLKLKNPAMLGSVWPSSDSLCSRLMGLADWSEIRHVVEYGPGAGTITRHILQQLRSHGTLIAIKKNPELAQHLRDRFCGCDSRLKNRAWFRC